MKRLTRAITALSVGVAAAFALAPVAAAAAATTPLPPKATLSGVAACVDGGWQATYTFTNTTALSAVIVDVDGDADPAVPITVAPGQKVVEKTGKLTGKHSWLSVTYRLEPLLPAPTATVTPTVTLGAVQAADDQQPKMPHKPLPFTSTHKIHAKVSRCFCPTPTPTSTTPTMPTKPVPTPTTTAPTTAPPATTTAPTPTPSLTTTPPVVIGGAAGGSGDSLPLTGSSVAYTVGGAAALLAAGIATVLLVRRRRTTFTA